MTIDKDELLFMVDVLTKDKINDFLKKATEQNEIIYRQAVEIDRLNGVIVSLKTKCQSQSNLQDGLNQPETIELSIPQLLDYAKNLCDDFRIFLLHVLLNTVVGPMSESTISNCLKVTQLAGKLPTIGSVDQLNQIINSTPMISHTLNDKTHDE